MRAKNSRRRSDCDLPSPGEESIAAPTLDEPVPELARSAQVAIDPRQQGQDVGKAKQLGDVLVASLPHHARHPQGTFVQVGRLQLRPEPLHRDVLAPEEVRARVRIVEIA